MAHLTYTWHTRASVSPTHFYLGPSLDSQQTSHLKHQSSSKRWGLQESSILIQDALGQSLHKRQSHPPAPSKSSGAQSCLLCWVEGWVFSLPSFLLAAAAAAELSTVPSGLNTAAQRKHVCMCKCNLLFLWCWLVLSHRLLNLWLWRNQILDLLCTDGYFIWLEPPLEMFQGARKEQEKRVTASDLDD